MHCESLAIYGTAFCTGRWLELEGATCTREGSLFRAAFEFHSDWEASAFGDSSLDITKNGRRLRSWTFLSRPRSVVVSNSVAMTCRGRSAEVRNGGHHLSTSHRAKDSGWVTGQPEGSGDLVFV